MMSKKGFLFTISVIFFASTLVIFSQTYLSDNILREKLVLNNEKAGVQPFVSDDVACDIYRIVGLDFDARANPVLGKVYLSFHDYIPKDVYVPSAVSSYSAFLDANYFPRVAGDTSLDVSNLSDGTVEIFFNQIFGYYYNSTEREAKIFQDNGAALTRIDLNIDVSNDLNGFEWITSNTGSVAVNIFYSDDSNSADFTTTINPLQESRLRLKYLDGNVDIVLGYVSSKTNSFAVDSNTPASIEYDLILEYSSSPSSLPIAFNSRMDYSNPIMDANTFVRHKN
ncbi:MAG: hypothetical protein AABW59_01635 [archaeon]